MSEGRNERWNVDQNEETQRRAGIKKAMGVMKEQERENVEIRDAVGQENFFLFGLDTDEVQARKAGGYRPAEYYEQNPALKAAIDRIASGYFSGGDGSLFQPLVDNLLHHDDYLVLADFQSYIDAQGEVDRAWADRNRWTRMSILNTARMGRFSSDRTISEYCRDIWRADPCPVELIDVE